MTEKRPTISISFSSSSLLPSIPCIAWSFSDSVFSNIFWLAQSALNFVHFNPVFIFNRLTTGVRCRMKYAWNLEICGIKTHTSIRICSENIYIIRIPSMAQEEKGKGELHFVRNMIVKSNILFNCLINYTIIIGCLIETRRQESRLPFRRQINAFIQSMYERVHHKL